jgi:hypothetical protein
MGATDVLDQRPRGGRRATASERYGDGAPSRAMARLESGDEVRDFMREDLAAAGG